MLDQDAFLRAELDIIEDGIDILSKSILQYNNTYELDPRVTANLWQYLSEKMYEITPPKNYSQRFNFFSVMIRAHFKK